MTESKGISSAVVAVGDELLIGETLDGNGSWLSKKLTNLGTPVTGRWVTGDDPVAIKQTIMTALERSELVIVTGGLGPTIDDLTRPSVAELFGLKLIVNQSLVDQLRSRFSTIGYEMLPVRNLVQAEVPEGAIIIPNCEGTAPGLIIENEGKSVVLLPGVPHEMQSMFDRSVTEYINKRFQSRLDPILQRTFNTSGIPESLLAEELDKDISRFPSDVSVAFLPGLQGVSLRLTAPFSGGQGLGSLDFCENIIETTLAPYCYSVGKKSIMDSLAECLLMDKKCFAVGESCTGGLISKHITDLPGSSRYFKGGIVAYDVATKSGVLGIDKSVIEEKGVVSEEVAALMAERITEVMKADFGIGLTGIAGPDGGTKDNPVGTICYAVAGHDQVISFRKIFQGNRESIRERAAQAALFSLFRILTNRQD